MPARPRRSVPRPCQDRNAVPGRLDSRHHAEPFDEDTDRAYVDAPDHEIERPLRPVDGQARIRIVADGSAIVAYVNDVALSTRGYDLSGGVWGLVVAGGSGRFLDARVGRLRG